MDDEKISMESIKIFLKNNYKRNELAKLAKKIGCPKTSLVEWYEGRAPSFKNLKYIKKLVSIHGLTLDEVLFQKEAKSKYLEQFIFEDKDNKYIIEIKNY